jgi:hypothetical protein
MSPFTRRAWSTLKLLQADTPRKLARTRFSVNPQDQTRCTVIGRSTAIRGMTGWVAGGQISTVGRVPGDDHADLRAIACIHA